MKSLLALLAAVALLPIAARAQQTQSPEAASLNPTQATPTPGPAGSPALSGSEAASAVPLPGEAIPASPTLEKPLPLMPENIPSSGQGGHRKGGKSASGGEPGAAATPPKSTLDVEQDIRVRIHLRIAQTQALNDPKIQADWYAAHQTRTDPDRRVALTKYYNDLAALIIKIDPSVAKQADARRQSAIDRLHYTHLGDEIPDVDPFATPPPPAEGQNPPSPDTVSGY